MVSRWTEAVSDLSQSPLFPGLNPSTGPAARAADWKLPEEVSAAWSLAEKTDVPAWGPAAVDHSALSLVLETADLAGA